MKAVGQYDTDGNYQPFREPVEVVRFGDSLREPDTGITWAVLDEYGDWVSPILKRFNRKSIVEVRDQ